MSVSSDGIPGEEFQEVITIFSTLPAQFPDVSRDMIRTKQFLDASSAMVTLVEKFGKVFSPVIYDMNGNIKKITTKYNEDREKYKYLEDMILSERNDGGAIATDALMWLRRALHFLSTFFQYVIEDTSNEQCSPDLRTLIKNAYSETLEQYHGWLGTQLFNVLSRFAPNRRHLIYTLASDQHNQDAAVIKDMKKYNEKMSGCVKKLLQFYKDHDLESYSTV
ncbi:hypothetical protein NQ317_007047 [Molorchus minor]|uniref:Glycolipid transfer protein domain-containing protein n=1 Tax=Molorchus minor TaxID=1323400 RepID=A0ABQ9K5H4_9CUCU|nr:hypothetical protein NQ317_007047 [Molorchus minor]